MQPWQPFARIGAEYGLNPAEQRLSEYLARARQNARVGANSTNVRRNPAADDLETHRNGVAGELAFCRLHNCYPDLTIGVTPEGDALCAGGILVDVKTRPDNWDLLVMPEKVRAVQVDVFALMIGSFPGPYRFAGAIGRDAIINDAHSKPEGLGYGPLWLASQTELVDLNEWYVGYRERCGA